MDVNEVFGGTAVWPIDDFTPAQRRELIIRADTVRGIFMDRDPGRVGLVERRLAMIGSRELAARFDPIQQTAQHVGALLLGVNASDAKWLYGAGIPTELVMRIDSLAEEWLARKEWTAELWVERMEATFTSRPEPSDEQLAVFLEEVATWNHVLDTLANRPWLMVSWVDFAGEGSGHLAVHDGAFGVALHFDDSAGSTLGGTSVEAQSLDWEDLSALTATSTDADDSWVDWIGYWGMPTPEPVETVRFAVLSTLRASLTGADQGANDGYGWRARPAALGSDTGFSAYDLVDVFPTARAAVERYANMLATEFRNAEQLAGTAYWHEPLWVAHRAELPVLLFDEAGEVHLPSSSWLQQAHGLPALTTPTGATPETWNPSSFDIVRLLTRAQRWEQSWMAPSSAVVGDLLRAGAGFVHEYLPEN
ncbi:hypothetical protein PQI51_06350 [Microbacterium esteraromaticum]|uniref:hypothetical protein n=1 Tax=Microbacterium esteraromaticum TaxID=57043 RepID=UPI0030B11C27